MVFAINPSIAIAPILHHNHDPAPDIVIAVVVVVLLVFLDEVQDAAACTLLYTEFAQRDAPLCLFDDATQGVIAVVYAEELSPLEFLLQVTYVEN